MAKKRVEGNVVSTPIIKKPSKLQVLKSIAFAFAQKIAYPNAQEAFSVKAYEVTPTGKKPNALSAPEVAAIVGTAAKLGKKVEVRLTGVGDGGTLQFLFVDQNPSIPAELY